ncbi:MAG: hypothetical protein ACUVWN_12075 [bacterium]
MPEETPEKGKAQEATEGLEGISGLEELELPDEKEGEAETETPEVLEKNEDAEDVEYEIDGISFSKKDFKRMYERDQQIKREQSNLHNWGQKLNLKEKELKQKEAEIKEIKALADEYRKAQEVLKANPKAYEYLRKLIDEGGGEVSPRIKAIEEKLSLQEEKQLTDEAEKALMKEIKDFDYSQVTKFMDTINWDDRKSVMRFQYWAMLGSRFEEEMQKRLAEISEKNGKKKALPPLKGGGKAPEETKEFATTEELVKDALEFLKSGKY